MLKARLRWGAEPPCREDHRQAQGDAEKASSLVRRIPIHDCHDAAEAQDRDRNGDH